MSNGTHWFRVAAADSAGNVDPTPATRTWTIQATTSTPPDTTITAQPPATTTSTSASFSFTSTASTATFACSLDGSAFTACTSPAGYTNLTPASHTFKVAATDQAGNTDPSPATYTWTIQATPSTPPDTTITAQPPATTTSTSASFSFSSASSDAAFVCSLDGSAFTACTSPAGYTNLTPASHTFKVAATDQAGNTDPSPATYTWTIQATPSTPPDTTITAQPPATTTSTSASFSFSSASSDAAFVCSLDGSDPSSCTSPITYSGLGVGSHTFRVAASDSAGTDPTPAAWTWTIQSPPPPPPPAPKIAGFSPSSGGAGTTVVVNGSNLANAASVQFGGAEATIVADSASQITALLPAGATTGPIVVATPGGTATSSGTFKVLPRILTVTPGSGSAGDEIEISGGGFSNVTSVKFNGVPDTGFVVDSSTRISGHIPAGAQTGHLTVSTLAGSSSSPRSLLVVPAIDAFTPSSSSTGAHITISGRSFLGASAVKFGGIGAGYHIDSPTRITATVPNNAGTGPISITSPGGTGTSTNPFHVLPRLTSFSPSAGGATTTVTLYGTGLANATGVQFNGTDATISSDTATQIKVLVPAAATTGPITITTPEGSATSSTGFKVLPRILTVTPGSGSAGDEIEISGGGFSNVTSVKFNGVPDTGFVVDSSTRISGHIPAGAQTGHLTVSTLAGSSSSPRSLLVVPAIDAFTPSSSSTGAHITISGRSFLGATAVKFGGIGAGFHIDSPTQITATVPNNARTGPISITSPGGTGTSTNPFHVLPRLTSFSRAPATPPPP